MKNKKQTKIKTDNNVSAKNTNEPVELNDEQVEKVNGGIKIVLWEKPKFIASFLRLIFKVKKKPTNNQNTDTVITTVIADDNDNAE